MNSPNPSHPNTLDTDVKRKIQNLKINTLIEGLQVRSTMQLAMGELTMTEYLAAKAAVRYAITTLDKWHAVDWNAMCDHHDNMMEIERNKS
jgi:hypothetical protein